MKKILTITLFLLLLAGLFNSCKESPNDATPKESKVEFVFSSSLVKSTSEQGLTNIVITVEDLQGNTILNSEKIEIYHMNDRYISEPVALIASEYKLSRFLVLNGENDVVYATPKEGSDKAHLVENPLPVNFLVSEDSMTLVTPEVVPVANSTPEEFGYVSFSFDIADSFKILMGAAILDTTSHNYILTDAYIDIVSDTTLVYQGELNPYSSNINPLDYDSLNLVNEILLPEEYEEFTIIVTKWGYQDYNKTFTKEELRLYCREEDKGPLIVVLGQETGGDTCIANAGLDQVVYTDTTSLSALSLSIGDGHWSVVTGSGTLSAPFSPQTLVSGLQYGDNIFRWSVELNNQTCYDEITVFYESSIVNAGIDQVLCSDSTHLHASDQLPGTGTWSIIAGSGVIEDINDPKTLVTNLGLGTNTFRWTTNNGGSSNYDEVDISNMEIGPISAGADQAIHTDSTSLQASIPSQLEGVWSVVSGSGVFADINSPQTDVSEIGVGLNIYMWTVINGGCIKQDEVEIVYEPQ